MRALVDDNEQKGARIRELELQLFGKPELWCVHLVEVQRLIAAASKDDAFAYAQTINQAMGREGAVVIPSPMPTDVHLARACDNLKAWLSVANLNLADAQRTIAQLTSIQAATSESAVFSMP